MRNNYIKFGTGYNYNPFFKVAFLIFTFSTLTEDTFKNSLLLSVHLTKRVIIQKVNDI